MNKVVSCKAVCNNCCKNGKSGIYKRNENIKADVILRVLLQLFDVISKHKINGLVPSKKNSFTKCYEIY